MKGWILENWKGKITSLLLAVAIWYLIDANLRRPDRVHIPVPGTSQPQLDTSPNSVVPIPGGGSPSSSNGYQFPPAEHIEAQVERQLFGMVWIEQGEFADSVTEFPGVTVALSDFHAAVATSSAS